jgi:hypothetical protein
MEPKTVYTRLRFNEQELSWMSKEEIQLHGVRLREDFAIEVMNTLMAQGGDCRVQVHQNQWNDKERHDQVVEIRATITVTSAMPTTLVFYPQEPAKIPVKQLSRWDHLRLAIFGS